MALWNEEPVQLTWGGLYRSAGGTRCCCWCCAARLRGPAGPSRCPPGRPPQPESEACPPPPSAPPGSGQRTPTLSQEHQVRTLTPTPTPGPVLTLQDFAQHLRLRSQGCYVQGEAASAVPLCEGRQTCCLLLETTDVPCRQTLVNHLT